MSKGVKPEFSTLNLAELRTKSSLRLFNGDIFLLGTILDLTNLDLSIFDTTLLNGAIGYLRTFGGEFTLGCCIL